jgi:hypothetical protein
VVGVVVLVVAAAVVDFRTALRQILEEENLMFELLFGIVETEIAYVQRIRCIKIVLQKQK